MLSIILDSFIDFGANGLDVSQCPEGLRMFAIDQKPTNNYIAGNFCRQHQRDSKCTRSQTAEDTNQELTSDVRIGRRSHHPAQI